MSRPAINRLLPARPLLLAVGRSELRLTNGKQTERRTLAEPLTASLPSTAQLASLQAALADLLAGFPAGRWRLDITFSDALGRAWIVERIPGLRDPAEITALAEAQLQEIYGDSSDAASQWLVRVDATAFAAGWPAMALPRALIETFETLAVERNWSFGRLESSFVAAFNGRRQHLFRRKGTDVHALATDDALVIGIRNGTQWRALRSHPPLRLLGGDLSAMLRRECRPLDLSPAACRVEELITDSRRSKELQLDFAPAKASSPLRVGLGSAMLALLLALLWSNAGDIEAGLPPHQALLPGGEEVRAINGAIEDLDFPWGRVLGLLEASIDQSLRISHFDADVRTGRLTISGEARDSHVVLELPARWRADPLVAEARVLSQSPVDAENAGIFTIRFAVEVTLNGGGRP
ncbi:hypothetical protein [Quatrionicoccus australiensis]|uniref:hypothetical protein n=1 Tax=Quatrionicoccus australiensis TaxID=138118 RepID=UPI001CFC419F|nr:hypothetical protein [Quatrionicoccus australiensis]MCB4361765.1 hypothetical protein [Quatrionicoccus australiensis]